MDRCVVFSNNCDLSRELLNEPGIYTFSSFEEALEDLQLNGDDIYNDASIEQMDEMIGSLNQVSMSEHIKNVNEIKNM